ncbi:hypothetical protein I7I48_02584 [Histoplasma ohiense]|nr:hypothetical protein I7I48_02584 [Histoplasma ohiense (nom. inval.)]
MSLISKLPTELVEEIARHMDKCVLKNFGSVCWRFRSIVEPRLYEAIRLNDPETSYREVLKLLIAIDKRPRMVSRTEAVTISERYEDADESELVKAAKLDPKVTMNEVISLLLSKLPILHSFYFYSRLYLGLPGCDLAGPPLNFSHLKKIVNLRLPWFSLSQYLSSTPVLPPTLARLEVEGYCRIEEEKMERMLIDCVQRKSVEGPGAGGLKVIAISYLVHGLELKTICKNKWVSLEQCWDPYIHSDKELFGR